MNTNKNYVFLLVLLTLIFLGLASVSATETNQTDTTDTIQHSSADANVMNYNDDTTVKNTIKKENKTVKTATKQVYYDIKIYNNLVGNATTQIAVMDANTEKAIPNSKLNITLPNSTSISTTTLNTGYRNVTMNLPAGNNTIKITYPGTSTYHSYSYDLTMEVFKRNPSMQIGVNVANNAANTTINLTDVINKQPIKNGKIQVKVSDGREFTVTTNNNGIAKLSTTVNPTYNILDIKYIGSNVYNPANTSVVIPVGTPKRNVNYSVAVNNRIAQNTSITINVTDYENGKILPNTKMALTVDGKTYTSTTNNKGLATFTLNLSAGNKKINFTNTANSTYNARNETINITVLKHVSDMNLTLQKNKDNTFTLTSILKDLTTNKPIANAPITISYQNKTTINTTTNTKGNFSKNVIIKEGTQNITVKYPGNQNITNVTKILTVDLPKSKIPTTFNVNVNNNIYQDDVLNISLIDASTNKTIKNTDITIKLPSKTIKTKTNSNGYVIVDSNLPVGTSNITLSYAGDNKYQNMTATVPIKIVPRPTTISSTITLGSYPVLNLTLKDRITNKTLPNAKIIVQHPQKNITYTTDKNGKLNTILDLPAGKAKLTIVYPGNATHSTSSSTATITVAKKATTTTAKVLNNTSGNLTLQVKTVTTFNNKSVTNGTITIKSNNQTVATKNITTNTPINIRTSLINRGNYTLNIEYSGDDNYLSSHTQVKTTITKTKIKTTTTTENVRVQIGDTATLKAKVTAANNKVLNTGVIRFYLNNTLLKDSNNKIVEIQVKNGSAQVNYKPPYSWRNQNIRLVAEYLGTDEYIQSNSTKANLALPYRWAPLVVTTNQSTTKMDETITFTATIKDTITVNDGVVIFKINGLTVKDKNGKDIQTKVVNNKASINFTIPDGWSAKAFKLTAVYANKNYKRLENKTYFNLTKTKTHFNVADSNIKVVNRTMTITGSLLDEHNHAVTGQSVTAIKINGKSLLRSNNKTQYFAINNGTISFTFKLPDYIKQSGKYTISFVTGDRLAYLGSRLDKTITIKL